MLELFVDGQRPQAASQHLGGAASSGLIDKTAVQMLRQSLAQQAEGGLLHRCFQGDVGLVRLDARETTALGQQLELHEQQQRLHRGWDGAIAIHPASRQFHQAFVATAVGGGAIGGDLLVVFGDPVAGDEGSDRQINLGVIHRRDVLALNLGQALLQHLHIKIEADRFHLAALLHPQQVADAADLHVAHGQLIAAAQLGELLNRPQALARRFAQ